MKFALNIQTSAHTAVKSLMIKLKYAKSTLLVLLYYFVVLFGTGKPSFEVRV